MKKSIKKLYLSRETLRTLEELQGAHGGATIPFGVRDPSAGTTCTACSCNTDCCP